VDLIIYFAFLHPYILYGLEVYGNTFPSYLDKLAVLNNKLLRIESYRKKVVLVVTKVYICSIILCLLYSCLITRFWILYTKQYFLLIYCHLYSRIILRLQALFIYMKLDTTHFI